MFNFLCELHFWTKKDGIIVENSDFGAFVYHDRGDASGSNVNSSKSSGPCPILDGKKVYSEGRGLAFTLTNKRKKRLKDSLADLEDMLHELRVVCFEWSNSNTVRMVFENGHRTCIKISSQGDIETFFQDKFMVGKLANGSYLSDVAIHTQHAIFAFTDNLVTHVHISRPSLEAPARKWSTSDVKLLNERLAGPSGRRLDKTLSFTEAGDSLLVWWKATRDEVYPWSPQVHAQDRANVHIYSLNGAKFDLLCYYRTKFEPIQVLFSQIRPSTIYTLQQKVSDDGEVSLEWEVATLDCRTLRTNFILSLPLPTHVSALALSPKEDKLLATCIDGSLLVADSYGNITNKIRTNLIPSMALWHPDGALIVVANGKGQLQWFDSALAPVSCQLVSNSVDTTILDVGSYFKYQPNLVGIYWNRRANTSLSHSDALQDFLLFQFEKGPLVILKVLRPHEKKLSPDTLIYQYLSSGAFSSALNLLHTIDWEVDSELAMSSLHSLVSFLLRRPLSLSAESAIEKALGYFLNPIRPIPEEIITEVEDGVLDLARKFFHQLLRYQRFDKAFMLAIDLGKYDLFMDLYHYSKDIKNKAMAAAAWERAEELACSSCEDCSESSCDCSESHSSSDQSGPSDIDSESTQDLQEKIVPPLEIRSPLESSRHRVCYSTILQQHNFRRNPPTNAHSSAQDTPNASASNLRSRTSDFVTQPRFVHDYFRQDSKGIYLPIAINNDTLFTEGNCVVHHSNVPSSRAPLQFLPDDKCRSSEYNDDGLGNNVLSNLTSDQHMVPQSLKVANARRNHVHPSNFYSNPGSYVHSPNSAPNVEFIHSYPALESQNSHSVNFNGRSQPDGYSYSRTFSETQSGGLRGVRTFEKLPKLLTGQVDTCHAHSAVVVDVDSQIPSENGEALSDLSDNGNKLKVTNLVPSNTLRLSEVVDKSYGPIIAKAETEDGKIKVVHFGLV